MAALIRIPAWWNAKLELSGTNGICHGCGRNWTQFRHPITGLFICPQCNHKETIVRLEENGLSAEELIDSR